MPKPLTLPTEAELDILRVLWTEGPSTVRAVHEELPGTTGYTTTLKLLQNMHAKALVRRDETERQHVYSAAVDETTAINALVTRLVDRMFNGSSVALALRALGNRPVSAQELESLKRAIRAKAREETDE